MHIAVIFRCLMTLGSPNTVLIFENPAFLGLSQSIFFFYFLASKILSLSKKGEVLQSENLVNEKRGDFLFCLSRGYMPLEQRPSRGWEEGGKGGVLARGCRTLPF